MKPRLLPIAAVAFAGAAAAQTAPAPQRVEISGQALRPPLTQVTQDIEAAPASATVLDRRELDRLSVATYGDVFRNVTGVYVNDYGQGLVAYEIKMRGFNSGHGRDVAFVLDGMPLNVTGSQHTNGYADLSLLIPETLSRVEVVRGPFATAVGNHAVSGSVVFRTDRNTASQVKLDIDSFGRVRVLPVLNTGVGDGRLLLALDATKGSAYTDQSDLRRTNLLARWSQPLAGGLASVRLQHYDADADAPGYIDLARVKSGALGPKTALSPGIGDAKTQSNLVLGYQSDDPEGRNGLAGGWTVSAYAVRDDRKRWTNYDLNTPPGGRPDLGAERDRMNQGGLDLRKATMLGDAALPQQLLLGAQFNDERVDALHGQALASRDWRGDAATDVQRQVNTRTTALFAEYQVSPVRGFKLQAGLRHDRLAYDVTLKPLDDAYSATGSNRFQSSKRITSPKLGLAWALVGGASPLELFANTARGLKSPYTFGDFNRLPASGISTLNSSELGLRGDTAGFTWRAAVWRTRQDKEALFDAANRFIGNQKTNRDGFDLELGTELARDLRLSAHYSHVKPRLVGLAPNDRITGVPDWTAGLGLDGLLTLAGGRVAWSLRDAIAGPQDLLGDGSVRTRSYYRVTARGAYTTPSLPGTNLALSGTWVDRPLEETVFDFGGGQYGVAPKPRFKLLATLQQAF